MYPCIREKELRAASYVRDAEGELEISLEDEAVPFATWDPDEKGDGGEENEQGYERFAQPMRVTLEKGDMLYLPASWFVPSPLPFPRSSLPKPNFCNTPGLRRNYFNISLHQVPQSLAILQRGRFVLCC